MAKLDPYIQIDAGTMSPYEHGETFVTDDGFETDLDLGHYERYIDENLTRKSSVTTGQIYLSVIEKERRGDYLGKTVQVIPHVVNEIKERIESLSQGSDISIVEIGGTVWDIEWPHFIEAMRELRQEHGKDSVIFVHVAPVIHLSTSGEAKTKAIQHSIIKLREMGIQADILVCRSRESMDLQMKQKLAMFCDIPTDQIIEAIDQNIYQVPSSFKHQQLDQILIQRLFHKQAESNLAERETLVHKLMHPKKEINIALAGKYTHLDDCYISVLEALKHAGAQFETKVHIHRIETQEYENSDREQKLSTFLQDNKIQGIIIPWGFGERGVEGMINIANYTRTQNIPYLWLCLGLQIATISFARNICKLETANSTEFIPETANPVITILETQKTIKNKGATMRLGSYPAILKTGSKVFSVYNKFHPQNNQRWSLVQERHRHRFEINPAYHDILETNGLTISGKSPDGQLAEFIEITDHKFYVATQAHPELKSRLTNPHPLFLGLLEACLQ